MRRIITWTFSAVAIASASTAAAAQESAQFILAPATAALPVPKLAVQYQLELRLPEGRGLARILLDAGVNQDDAAAAAKLAAGHLGDGDGGCLAKVSVTRSVGDQGYRLVRVMLSSDASQTVIERRGGELTVASNAATARFPRLV